MLSWCIGASELGLVAFVLFRDEALWRRDRSGAEAVTTDNNQQDRGGRGAAKGG